MSSGVFGLAIQGLPGAECWLHDVGAPLETVDVVREGRPGPGELVVDDRRARFLMADDVVVETRRDAHRIAVRSGRPVTDDDLVHPFISPTIAVRHLWAGRQVLHSGVVGTPEGAVLVLGGREFGKSSTLAELAARSSLVVFSDDLCITDGTYAWTGPRCIDLRQPAVAAFAEHWSGRIVRSASRWRMPLGAAPPRVRLLGSVLLGWSAETRVGRCAPADALRMAVACKMHAEIPSDPVALLSVGALPMLSIERERTLSTLAWTSKHVEEWVHELLTTSPADH